MAHAGEEVWALAVGPGAVEVSNLGNLRNLATGGRPLAPTLGRKNGYLRVFGHNLHTVVMNSFSERPSADAIVLHHGEENRANNSLANLKWGTYKENGQDMIRHGTSLQGSKHPRTQLTEARVEEGLRLYAAGKMTQDELSDFWGGIGQGNVVNIVKGRAWGHVARPAALDTGIDRRVGEHHHLSDLTDKKVAEGLRLVAEKGWGSPTLGKHLGISTATAAQILSGITWKHVPRPAKLQQQMVDRKTSLTDEKVAEGLRLAAENNWTGAQLGEYLGVSRAVGGEILGGRAWTHVPRPEGLTIRSVAASLTDEQVYDGLVQAKANGWGATQLGEYLGVKRGVAHKILSGTGYKHVRRPT